MVARTSFSFSAPSPKTISLYAPLWRQSSPHDREWLEKSVEPAVATNTKSNTSSASFFPTARSRRLGIGRPVLDNAGNLTASSHQRWTSLPRKQVAAELRKQKAVSKSSSQRAPEPFVSAIRKTLLRVQSRIYAKTSMDLIRKKRSAAISPIDRSRKLLGRVGKNPRSAPCAAAVTPN